MPATQLQRKRKSEADLNKPSWLIIALYTVGCSGASAADLPIYKAPPTSSSVGWSPSLTAYTLFDVYSFRSAFPGHEFKARGYQSTSGLNYTLTPQWTLGGGLIYNYSDTNLTYLGPAARSDSDGLTGFVTTAYTIPDLFTVGGSAGWGKAWTHQSRFLGGVQSIADYDATVHFASIYISKSLQYGNLFVTPAVRLLHRESKTEAYFEPTIGVFNPEQTSTLGELSYGSQFSLAIPTTSGWTYYPTLEVFGLHHFKLPLYQSERNGLDLKAGLSATVGSWSMGVAYMTILGLDSYRDFHGGRIFLSRAFGGPPQAAPSLRREEGYTYLRPTAVNR